MIQWFGVNWFDSKSIHELGSSLAAMIHMKQVFKETYRAVETVNGVQRRVEKLFATWHQQKVRKLAHSQMKPVSKCLWVIGDRGISWEGCLCQGCFGWWFFESEYPSTLVGSKPTVAVWISFQTAYGGRFYYLPEQVKTPFQRHLFALWVFCLSASASLFGARSAGCLLKVELLRLNSSAGVPACVACSNWERCARATRSSPESAICCCCWRGYPRPCLIPEPSRSSNSVQRGFQGVKLASSGELHDRLLQPWTDSQW